MSRINVRNIARIDLNLLLTFHCLMSERSATRAAVVLHVTQGAVSAALRRLREHFGDELFIRSASGMQPTRKAMELAAAAEGLGVSFAFHQSNSSLWKQSLLDPDMDLVICSEPKDFNTSYSSQVLFSSSYSCLFRPRGSMAGAAIGLDDYFAANHVRISYDGRRGFIDDLFESAGYARRVTASFTHFAGALSTLMSGEVIATLPTFAAETYSRMMDLHCCPVPLPVPSFRCFMVWDVAKHNKTHHDWLRRFVGEIAQRLG
ncbi:LysR family transcriptional regulator [Pseudomonas paraeruginosa]|uniref:LysR family transcriptional regulator n=1 Tax=Pseudomonas paraeruginosa TaxID=2994495 RepID=UPI0006B89B7B|nr:LysR family transcriptional regulator [Pseudomonas paraeruginosa]KPD26553.1 transcriptional regulator [Pseudomonas paraeruginosa]